MDALKRRLWLMLLKEDLECLDEDDFDMLNATYVNATDIYGPNDFPVVYRAKARGDDIYAAWKPETLAVTGP